jgi:hypothetical protein
MHILLYNNSSHGKFNISVLYNYFYFEDFKLQKIEFSRIF